MGFGEIWDWRPWGAVPEVAADELAARLAGDEPPQLLDVRSVAEWRQGHLAGARHLPVTELAGGLDALPLDRGRPVVVICLTAHRSPPAVRHLRRRGFRDVAQLAGGLRAWRAAGLPLAPGRRG